MSIDLLCLPATQRKSNICMENDDANICLMSLSSVECTFIYKML